jgi:hypothetical protein
MGSDGEARTPWSSIKRPSGATTTLAIYSAQHHGRGRADHSG